MQNQHFGADVIIRPYGSDFCCKASEDAFLLGTSEFVSLFNLNFLGKTSKEAGEHGGRHVRKYQFYQWGMT
jgi:hypothetical protein